MNKTSIITVIISVIVSVSVNAYSQPGFSIHAGPAFPLSEFGDDDNGGASIGINLGAKQLFMLNEKGLGYYIGADFNLNGIKSSVKDDVKDLFDELGADIDVSYFKYINVPVTTGLNYIYKANDQLSLFGDFGIGADFMKLTKMTVEAASEKVDVTYKLSTQLAFKLGAGLLFSDKYSIGLFYYGLGSHNPDGEINYNGTIQEMDGSSLDISMLTLTFGIKL